LPREKPLPKPKPPTKWERFAAEKGISHKTRERDVWDDEKQEFVRRWGRGGKNKEGEDQWLHEVKAKAGELTVHAAHHHFEIHTNPRHRPRPRRNPSS